MTRQCNRNPVGTRCEVLVSGEWRTGYVGGFGPDHIRIRVAGRRDVLLTNADESRFRVFDYEAGLRRAQELAYDEIVPRGWDGAVSFADFNAAIDAEIEKVRNG